MVHEAVGRGQWHAPDVPSGDFGGRWARV